MLETSARLLRLLTVLQTRRFWAGSDLSEHLDVTPRTLRRDMDKLRSLGYAVDATSGPGGGYQIGKGAAVPPLQLTDEEAVAVAVALRSAADMFVGLSDVAMSVLSKLDQVLPARLRRRISALQSATVSLGGGAATVDAELLTVLATACRDHETLEFAYSDRAQMPTRRTVEPLRLAHVGNRRWYLVAWDVERAAFRTFRVDRIQKILSVGSRFIPKELPEDFAKFVSKAISHAPYRHRARLKLSGSARSLEKSIPPWCGVIEPLDDESAILSTGAGSIEALVCQMVLTGVDFEILEPRALAPQVHEIAQRLARATKPKE